jgi:hypothetical protein
VVFFPVVNLFWVLRYYVAIDRFHRNSLGSFIPEAQNPTAQHPEHFTPPQPATFQYFAQPYPQTS